jgi:hypothetical protein
MKTQKQIDREEIETEMWEIDYPLEGVTSYAYLRETGKLVYSYPPGNYMDHVNFTLRCGKKNRNYVMAGDFPGCRGRPHNITIVENGNFNYSCGVGVMNAKGCVR